MVLLPSVSYKRLKLNGLPRHRRVYTDECRRKNLTLSPFIDNKGVIRVGGRVDNGGVSYDSRHPALLPYEHSISLLITRHMPQCGHAGVASTTVKIRVSYWILKASKLAKSAKFKCAFYREMARRVETHKMADLPSVRLAPLTPSFHYTACDYFGPFKVKVGRNKTAKHYGVIFTCLNTRAVHLEMAVESFWKRWKRDVFPTLVPTRKWRIEQQNVRIDDVVTVTDEK